MPLCRVCKDIDLSAFIAHGRSKETALPAPSRGVDEFLFYSDPNTDTMIPHYGSTDELNISATSCKLCALMMHCVNGTLAEYQTSNSNLRDAPREYEFFLAPRCSSDGFQILARNPSEDRQRPDFHAMGGVGLCVDDESPLATIVRGRMVSPSPISPGALRRIKTWIDTCCGPSHPNCFIEDAIRSLPTLILEIRSSGTEVLVRPFHVSNDATPYAVLSYCWGPVKPTSLNRDTAATLMAGVQTTALPKSFQDAVWLTHQLGLRHLWIDSLCIYQDNPDNWARESAHMGDIYGGAAVTIAASRAAGCSEGFLSDREPPEYVPIPIRTEAYSGTLLAFVLPKKYAGDQYRCARLEDEPLSSRGWALQERYLSKRTLHFGRSQTFFECPYTFEAEDLCIVGKQPHVIYDRDDWLKAVEQYSCRQLTFSDDKLPALSGLARRLLGSAYHSPGVYLAGLRRDNLVGDLCWALDRHAPSPGQRPLTYRAPTWSWASIDGLVEYFHSDCRPHLAIALDVQVDLDTPKNPFGKVTGGWLYMQALCLTPRPLRDSPETARYLEFREDDASFYMYVDWDAENCFLKESQLFVVPISWDRAAANNTGINVVFGPFCLIVTPTDHQVQKYKEARGFRRVASGVALPGKRDKAPLKRLCEKWTEATEKGQLEGMVLV